MLSFFGMRIAVSGTHFSGKTTLVRELVRRLEGYEGMEEAYVLMEEEGYLFSDPPVLEDYKAMAQRAARAIEDSGEKVIFDRCPLDYMAYAGIWEEEEVMGMLDLIIFVPIEEPDRILLPTSENRKLRRKVDNALSEMVMDYPFVEVTGTLEERVKKVFEAME